MPGFVLFCIIAGVLVGAFIGKSASASITKKQPVHTPSSVDTWWNNLKHTPLSEQESKQIAQQMAQLYMQWKGNSAMNHSWLCLGIDANKVSFR